jgi:hypothetical protein
MPSPRTTISATAPARWSARPAPRIGDSAGTQEKLTQRLIAKMQRVGGGTMSARPREIAAGKRN